MSLIGKSLDSIDRTDLQALIDNAVVESRYIEYKTEVGLIELSDKIKFLAGISSFGNSGGGDFLIGIRAENGIPLELIGLSDAVLDEAKLKIEQLIQTGLSPRLSVSLVDIRVENARSVLLLRVPRSWALPHRVTIQGHDKFYGRHSAGRFPMDVDQLRAAFLFSSSVNEQIEKRRERMLESALRTPFMEEMSTNPLLALHIIPYEVLDPSRVVDLQRADGLCPQLLVPLGLSYGPQRRFNADGIFCWQSERPEQKVSTYIQLYRSGMIEAVAIEERGAFSQVRYGAGEGTPVIGSTLLVENVLRTVTKSITLLQQIDVVPPIVIMLSILNAKGYVFAVQRREMYNANQLDRSQVLLPPVVMNSYAEFLPRVLRPLFDALWNAGGHAACTLYTAEGTLPIQV